MRRRHDLCPDARKGSCVEVVARGATQGLPAAIKRQAGSPGKVIE